MLIPFSFLSSQNGGSGGTYTLASSATVSLGIFKASDPEPKTLLRTLISAVYQTAGTYTVYWDGLDDNGNNILSTNDYEAKLVTNNITYTWEGVVGNSSTYDSGATVIRNLRLPFDAVIADDKLFIAPGYSEGEDSTISQINLSDIGQGYYVTKTGGNVTVINNATDGNYVYWNLIDPYSDTGSSFTFATSATGNAEILFSAGVSVSATYGETYPKAIDVETGTGNDQTGMAVQVTGNYLFISRGGIDEVRVLNKTTGAAVRTLSFTSPGRMTVDSGDNLWIISGTTKVVTKHTVNGDGTLSSATLTISGLSYPYSLSVSPDGSTISVLDAGSSQQIKSFSTSTGSPSWTLGQTGGYLTNSTVAVDKFMFEDINDPLVSGFVHYYSDGSFWVGDSGNARMLHFNSSRVLIDQINYLPMNYSANADQNDSTRAFSYFLEYSIDYSKPLGATNGSWELVKNWKNDIDGSVYRLSNTQVFQTLMTLSNGRTYSTLWDYINNQNEIVELVEGGATRFTGIYGPEWTGINIQKDGSLIYAETGGDVGTTATWYTRTLTGFDGSNNPIWASPTTIATRDPLVANEPAREMRTPVKTDSGLIIAFNPGKNQIGGTDEYESDLYHLGALEVGGTGYVWQTSNSTFRDYVGAFPDDGTYDIGNNVEYAGGNLYCVEDSIFWNYVGEFWKNSQTNKWFNVHKSGLLLNIFGLTGLQAISEDGPSAPAKMAGNVYKGNVVKNGSKYYVYHCDESWHGGLHRWVIDGLNTVSETTIEINNTIIPQPYVGVNLMSGLTGPGTLINSQNGWTRNPTSDLNGGQNDTITFKVGYMSYKSGENDVFMKTRTDGVNSYVTRSIGSISPSLTSWEISGNLCFYDNWPNIVGENPGSFFDVLDDTGKIITRIINEQDHSLDYNTDTWVKGNDVLITPVFTQEEFGYYIGANYQPFSIVVNSSSVTFSYYGYSNSTSSLYDNTANWNKPTTIKFTMIADVSPYAIYSHTVGVQNLNYTETI